jgi:hypothetical protein
MHSLSFYPDSFSTDPDPDFSIHSLTVIIIDDNNDDDIKVNIIMMMMMMIKIDT